MKSVFLSLSSLVLAFTWSACRKPNEFAPPPPPEVSVIAPDIEDVVLYQSFPGLVEATESVTLVARVSGFLEEVHFEDGAKVKAGDPLFTIEQSAYIAAVNAAKGTLAQAKAGLSLAEAALSRKQKAYESQAVSELDVLTAQANVESAQALVQEATASVEAAELNLSYTKIFAPMDGTLSRNYVSKGNLVGPGSVSELALLLSDEKAYVYFSVDERSLVPKLRLIAEKPEMMSKAMAKVKLSLADEKEYPLEGQIDYMDNSVDAQTGTLQVRAVYDNPNRMLVQGMFARVKIPDMREKAMLIPEVAIQRDMVGSYVYTLTAEDKVESVYIELGPLYGQQRIVNKGLSDSARVVLKGIQRVRPGAQVTVSGSSKGE